MRVRSRSRLLAFAAVMLLAAFGVAPVRLSAQLPVPSAPTAEQKPSASSVIMPHITDSKVFEYPCFQHWEEWACEHELPTWNVQIAGHTVDMGPTKHVVWLGIAAALALIILTLLSLGHVRETDAAGRPRGTPAGIEALVLYLRNEIFLPVLGGHGGGKHFPFVIALFFFVLASNLMGLIPFTSTPTGNVSVTAALALCTLVVIEVAGMRTLGAGYFKTIVYWPSDQPVVMKSLMTLIMTPIEIVGKLTKPFALTIRLFANMIAGHVIILSFILLVLTFGAVTAVLWVPMAVGIMLLEVLVAGIQAFIFALLAAVFIGQIRAAHH